MDRMKAEETLLPLLRAEVGNIVTQHGGDDQLAETYARHVSALLLPEGTYQAYMCEFEQIFREHGSMLAKENMIERSSLFRMLHNIRMSLASGPIGLPVGEVGMLLTIRWFDFTGRLSDSLLSGYLGVMEQRTNDLLQQQQSIMGHMAAGMAHEIRNPIASFSSFLQLMESSLHQEQINPTSFLNYIRVCKEEIASLEGLVRNFLILSRKDNQIDKQTGPVNLTAILHRVYETAKTFIFEKNVYLHFYYPQDQCWINGVSAYIEQICHNIIQNAVQAVADGGHLYVETTIHHLDQQVMITFTDNGHGIAEERLEKIFEPFFNTHERGTGIGLSICKHLVEEMKGTITVDSVVNKGTKVKVAFPLVTRD